MGKRFTLAHDRFQVTANYEGLVDTFQKKSEAFERANLMKDSLQNVEIFDTMAHKGNPQCWKPDGTIVSYNNG